MAMVSGNAGLSLATDHGGFDGYERDPVVVAAFPATGWNVRYEDQAGVHLYPVAGWAVFDDGSVTGIEINSDEASLTGDADHPFFASNAVGYEPDGGWPQGETTAA